MNEKVQLTDNCPWVGQGDSEIENFHYHEAAYQQDPLPFFSRLRSQCPVAHSNKHGGFWIFSKYEDVFRAYQETDLFSSFPASIPDMAAKPRRSIPLEMDPPDHAKYRRVMNPMFTLRKIAPLESVIRHEARLLIDEIKSEHSTFDYVQAFSRQLPTRVFLGIMGWPQQDAPKLVIWAHDLVHAEAGVPEEEERRMVAAMSVYHYFAEQLDARDELGPPDLSGDADFLDILRAGMFGTERPMTQFEKLDALFLLMIAGLDTTEGVLSFTTEYLATHDEVRKDLIGDPETLDTAVEEFLRFFAPVSPARQLTRDAEVRGVPMKEGDRVMLLTHSACRDEEVFEHADTVDIRRNPNRHVAFGAGSHRCLGASLARLELRVALEEWHKSFPDYRIKPGFEVKRRLSGGRTIDELQLEIA